MPPIMPAIPASPTASTPRSYSDGGLRYRRTLRLEGRRTTVMLEGAFWQAIAALARRADQSEESYLAAAAKAPSAPGQSLTGRIRTQVMHDLMRLADLGAGPVDGSQP